MNVEEDVCSSVLVADDSRRGNTVWDGERSIGIETCRTEGLVRVSRTECSRLSKKTR